MEDDAMEDDAKLDLEAWTAQEPPRGFADRVLTRIEAEKDPKRALARTATAEISMASRRRRGLRRAAWIGGAVTSLALAAAVALFVHGRVDARGDVVAERRTEVSVGSRARAVLEPGATLKWNDEDDVVQERGDVFYRVERSKPGGRFVVHTPAGDVEVRGTCFVVKVRGNASNHGKSEMNARDLKSGALGAGATALAFVAVYEGKVAVSHANERVEVAAGESARFDGRGVSKSGTPSEGERAFDQEATASVRDPLSAANENLVSQIGEYRRRLENIVAQKAELEATLKNTEQKLALRTGDASVDSKAEFDLGADDWKTLAKDGTVKFMIPCTQPPNWSPSRAQLDRLALAPDDANTLKDAYAKSAARLASVVSPLCAQILGNADLVDKIGMNTCVHLVVDQAYGKDKAAAGEAMREVGEMRAGMRSAFDPNVADHPIAKMFFAMTGETKAFENDLAASLGPEEAHRVVFAEGMCMGRSTFGGAGPREPTKE